MPLFNTAVLGKNDVTPIELFGALGDQMSSLTKKLEKAQKNNEPREVRFYKLQLQRVDLKMESTRERIVVMNM